MTCKNVVKIAYNVQFEYLEKKKTVMNDVHLSEKVIKPSILLTFNQYSEIPELLVDVAKIKL